MNVRHIFSIYEKELMKKRKEREEKAQQRQRKLNQIIES